MAEIDDVLIAPPPVRTETPSRGAGASFRNNFVLFFSAPLVDFNTTDSENSFDVLRPLSVHDEVSHIVDAVARYGGSAALTVHVCVLSYPLFRFSSLLTTRPILIHYVGHGQIVGGRAALVIENDSGAAQMFFVDDLRQILHNIGSPPCRIAVLNGCHTEPLAHAFIDAGVSHVIGVRATDEILDVAARCFAQSFYPAVLAGHTVRDAFAVARNDVERDTHIARLLSMYEDAGKLPRTEALKFRLLPDDRPHNVRVGFEESVGGVQLSTRAVSNIPLVASDPLVGRTLDLYYLCCMLTDSHSPRCIGIHGMAGMGKTVLSLALGRWQYDRDKWRDGVWFVEMRHVVSAAQARESITTALRMAAAQITNNADLYDQLQYKQMLIILDDVDQFIEAADDELQDLLFTLLSCPYLCIVTTSRRYLSGRILYRQYEVKRLCRTDAATAFKAYSLFDTVVHVGARIEEDLEKILEFLDGYPFSIRLAATYMYRKRCSISDMRRRLLDRPVSTLRYPGENEQRETSLKAALDLSYSVLPVGAREMLWALSLFPAGLSEALATRVFGPTALLGLEMLVQYSMAERALQGGMRRFILPEPARKYAEALQPPNAMDTYGEKVLEYFHDWSLEVERFLRRPHHNEEGRLEAAIEQPNVRTILDWGFKHETGRRRRCLSARIVANLSPYFASMVRATDQYEYCKSLYARAREAAMARRDQEGSARVGEAQAVAHVVHGNVDEGMATALDVLEIYRRSDEYGGMARCYKILGRAYERSRSVAKAIDCYRSAGRSLVQGVDRTVVARLDVAETVISTVLKPDETVGEAVERIYDLVQEVARDLENAVEWMREAADIHELVGEQIDARYLRHVVVFYKNSGNVVREEGDRLVRQLEALLTPSNSDERPTGGRDEEMEKNIGGVLEAFREVLVREIEHLPKGVTEHLGQTHEIALVAQPAQQRRASVWKRALLSALTRKRGSI